MKFLYPLVLFAVLVPAALANDHGAANGATPAATLEELKQGNTRFVDGKPSHRRADPVRRRELATGQQPSAIVLSCSDSRVPPELVFDHGLGEIFTVRVAGNVLGAATVASIEYAVEHLGARLIVVMGHESCGAVKAALTTPMGKSAGSPDLDALVSTIKPGLRDVNREVASEDKTVRGPVMKNVDAVGARLISRSRIVRKAVEEGRVAVVHAVYGLESGKVDFWHTDGVK